MENRELIKKHRLVLENGVSVSAERIILNPHQSNSQVLEHIRFVEKGTRKAIETKSVIRYSIVPYENGNQHKPFNLKKKDLLDYYNHQFVHKRFEK